MGSGRKYFSLGNTILEPACPSPIKVTSQPPVVLNEHTLCTQNILCAKPRELNEQGPSPKKTCLGQWTMGLNDGDSGGRGEEKPDSGYILNAKSIGLELA